MKSNSLQFTPNDWFTDQEYQQLLKNGGQEMETVRPVVFLKVPRKKMGMLLVSIDPVKPDNVVVVYADGEIFNVGTWPLSGIRQNLGHLLKKENQFQAEFPTLTYIVASEEKREIITKKKDLLIAQKHIEAVDARMNSTKITSNAVQASENEVQYVKQFQSDDFYHYGRTYFDYEKSIIVFEVIIFNPLPTIERREYFFDTNNCVKLLAHLLKGHDGKWVESKKDEFDKAYNYITGSVFERKTVVF